MCLFRKMKLQTEQLFFLSMFFGICMLSSECSDSSVSGNSNSFSLDWGQLIVTGGEKLFVIARMSVGRMSVRLRLNV